MVEDVHCRREYYVDQEEDFSFPFKFRCIRPNDLKSPDLFQPDKVLVQLRYTGVLETTRIRREVGSLYNVRTSIPIVLSPI